jgi:hypothetical protein
MGNPLKGEAQKMTASGCSPCTALTFSGGAVTVERSAKMWLITTPITGVASSCPFGVKCAYSGTISLLVENTKEGARASAEKELLARSEGSAILCGENTALTATYLANKDWMSSELLP